MTLSVQFATMLAMISMGIFFGAMLDTYNRFLKRRKRKSWLVFINDILFWVVQGLFIFYILFQVNQGELRFYIFIALLCGFAAYQSLFKQLYLKGLERIISFAISIFHFFVRLVYLLIYRPIHSLITTLIAIIIMIGKGMFILLKGILRFIWITVKILVKPIAWIFLQFWKFTPKNIKKIVDKLYNKWAGKLKMLKNYINSWISKWKKQKK